MQAADWRSGWASDDTLVGRAQNFTVRRYLAAAGVGPEYWPLYGKFRNMGASAGDAADATALAVGQLRTERALRRQAHNSRVQETQARYDGIAAGQAVVDDGRVIAGANGIAGAAFLAANRVLARRFPIAGAASQAGKIGRGALIYGAGAQGVAGVLGMLGGFGVMGVGRGMVERDAAPLRSRAAMEDDRRAAFYDSRDESVHEFRKRWAVEGPAFRERRDKRLAERDAYAQEEVGRSARAQQKTGASMIAAGGGLAALSGLLSGVMGRGASRAGIAIGLLGAAAGAYTLDRGVGTHVYHEAAKRQKAKAALGGARAGDDQAIEPRAGDGGPRRGGKRGGGKITYQTRDGRAVTVTRLQAKAYSERRK